MWYLQKLGKGPDRHGRMPQLVYCRDEVETSIFILWEQREKRGSTGSLSGFLVDEACGSGAGIKQVMLN